jgi:hypothetical protein
VKEMRIKIVALVLIALCLILTVLAGVIDLRLGLALAAVFGFLYFDDFSISFYYWFVFL